MIIITGASSGIGEFLYSKYSKNTEEIIGIYNNSSKENLIKVDITNESEVIDFYSSLSGKITNLTLINCAGVNFNGLTKKMQEKTFRDTIDVNLIGTFLMIKHALNYMLESNWGRIINISSIVPQIGVAGTSAYSASKSALWGLSKTVAIENAKKGITCNCLNLGYFNIGMIKQVPDQALEKILQQIPMQKLGDPEDIFNAVEFIRKSDYITGTNIDINGGLF
jgi:NAD(P)-dependent dehydrogenase (short-subunit alcohol dehydrogenase family)